MNAKSEEWVRDTILAIRQLLFQSRVSVVLFLGVFAAHPYYFISLFSLLGSSKNFVYKDGGSLINRVRVENEPILLFITCELILVILIIIVILRLRQQVERGMVTRLCRSGVCVGLLPITSFDLLFPAPNSLISTQMH